MAILEKHKLLETNATLLLVFSFLVVTIGGIVEIAPLFYIDNTIEKVEGVRPYSPLEMAGRDVYIREGCRKIQVGDLTPVIDACSGQEATLHAPRITDEPHLESRPRDGPQVPGEDAGAKANRR